MVKRKSTDISVCPNGKFSFIGRTIVGNGSLPRSWIAISETAYQNRRTLHLLRVMDTGRMLVLDQMTQSEWCSLQRSGWDIERDIKSKPVAIVK